MGGGTHIHTNKYTHGHINTMTRPGQGTWPSENIHNQPFLSADQSESRGDVQIYVQL